MQEPGDLGIVLDALHGLQMRDGLIPAPES